MVVDGDYLCGSMVSILEMTVQSLHRPDEDEEYRTPRPPTGG